MNFEAFITATNGAASPQATYDLFREAMRAQGFDLSVYCFLTAHAAIGAPAGLAVAYDYPDPWAEHYLASQYQNIDPMIEGVMRNSSAFAWDDTPADASQQRLLNEAKEFGLYDGLALPLHGMNGEVAAIGIASTSANGIPPAHRLSLLQAYAQQFHYAYIANSRENAAPPRILLTPKEREVLLWLAEGKTTAEIGDILYLSEDAIRYHLKSLFRKLGAKQRTQAVIIAIRHRLINPYRIGDNHNDLAIPAAGRYGGASR